MDRLYQCYLFAVDDFRKEDLAAAMVTLIANNIAQSAIAYAAAYKTKYVLIGGSLASHALIRHELMKAYSVRRSHNPGVINLEIVWLT